jgi:hypothetical protein
MNPNNKGVKYTSRTIQYARLDADTNAVSDQVKQKGNKDKTRQEYKQW